MPKINSLYTLIKEISQQKGRPLKIVVDWDECLFAFRPFALYEIGQINKPFKDFFKEFWENTTVISGAGSSQERILGYTPNGEEEKLAWEKWNKINEERKKVSNKNDPKYSRWVTELHDPYLSTAEELLKCLKEGLIDKLLIISATKSNPSLSAERKGERFNRSFGKFSQCSLNIPYVVRIYGKNKPHRWETIRDNCPDFDIFVDDDDAWIKSVREHFPDRTYALIDYKFNQGTAGDNIYHVKTTVSDLKDEDFTQAANEYKSQKKQGLASRQAKREREASIWKQPALYIAFMSGVGVSLLGLGVYWMLNKENKKSSNKK